MVRLSVFALALLAACAGPGSGSAPAGAPPKPAFAKALSRPGLPNLHRVDDGVYRGAQPTAEGMRELEKLGVKTVLNLRSMHSDRDLLRGTDLESVEIPMHAWHGEEEDVRAAMAVLTDPARRPVFVHCQHGADRTGVICALYRVLEEGWSKEDAIREMTEGDFGFHPIWQNLVGFVEEYPVGTTTLPSSPNRSE